MYNYTIESELVVWNQTDNWQFAIDEWSELRTQMTVYDGLLGIYVRRNGEIVKVLISQEDIKNHSEFLLSVRDSSNRVEGRIMMDMYEQEVNGMNVIEPKDKLDLPKEWQEPYTAYILRKTKEETNYMLADEELDYKAAVAEMEGSDLTVDFHGNFEQMDDDTQDAIINPKHYKMIPKEAYADKPEGLEYMDLMEYILAHHEGVESHLLGQVFKYACRLGKKDAKLQDAKKIAWYANRLVTVIEKGQ